MEICERSKDNKLTRSCQEGQKIEEGINLVESKMLMANKARIRNKPKGKSNEISNVLVGKNEKEGGINLMKRREQIVEGKISKEETR